MENSDWQNWLSDWVLWVSLACGFGVTSLIFTVGIGVSRFRHRRSAVREEDLPWEDLLEVLKERYRGKSAADEKLAPDELLDLLLMDMPGGTVTPEDASWTPGSERRRSRRRWSNPVEVRIISPFHEQPVHGLVINRSTGGLAILTDVEFAPNTALSVRPVEVPEGTNYADVRVRHARQVSKLWILGCEYSADVPWNVKVWFG
jgi:hypothetical protein